MDDNGYLILSRKQSEKLVIDANGQRIEVVVARLKPGRVTLALKADKSVTIRRAELEAAA